MTAEKKTSRRRFLWYLGGVAAAVIIGGAAYSLIRPTAPGEEKKTFKIGLLAPLTGVLTNYGQIYPKGTELGVEKVNEEGGILGKKVEYVVEDDKTDPATAAEKAKKLILRDKVDVLMGTVSSATTLAVIPIVTEEKIPYFWVVEGENKNCLKGDKTKTNRYVFGIGETPEQKFIPWVPWMLKNFGKKFYFVGSDYVFPHYVNSIGISMIEDQGGEVVGEEYAPLGTSDFSAIISRIAAKKPEVLFTSVVGTDGIAFVKQAKQFGLDKQMVITGFPSFSTEVFPAIADVAEGVYTVEKYNENLPYPENKEFVKRWREKYGAEWPVPVMGATMYDMVRLWKLAVEKAGSFDREKIIDALEGLKMNTTWGPIEINPKNHQATMHMLLLKIENRRYKIVQDFGMVEHPDHSGCSTGGI
jgi:ABC-type branched-subunit amino acid transport system substrate-binding protein